MLHNQIEIDGAWQEGTITSARGDKAQVRVNSITKEVWIKTLIGDGNHAEWRKTNSTYEAIMAQRFVPIGAGAESEPKPITPELAIVSGGQEHGQTNGHKKAEPMDLQSVQPLGHTKKKGRE